METGTMRDAAGFLPGKTLPTELRAAMKRLTAYGVMYPEEYDCTLLEKYAKEGMRYPHILMVTGRPRITSHFFYPRAVKRTGRLLDYGCGTGDNVRQLIRDGFPRGQITAFDINRESIDLGFDLYRDREDMEDLFVVAGTFPFGPEVFDTVYSASVIHVIADDAEFRKYLANVIAALRPGGVLFGSTLGLAEGAARPHGMRGPPRILTKEQLAGFLTGTGFGSHEVVRRDGVPGYVPGSDQLCVLEFCTKKQASCSVSSL
jgi:SAM-dependent methyltransferase